MQDGVEGGDDKGNKKPGPNVEVGASLQPKDPAGYNIEIERYHLAANPLHTSEHDDDQLMKDASLVRSSQPVWASQN